MQISDIRNQFVELYKNKKYVRDKSNVNVLEICGASFIADEDHIFGVPNENYIAREIRWYDSMIRNVRYIEEPIPKIWRDVCGEDGYVNSNYGWCIYSPDNHNQYINVLRTLKIAPDSRRACMIYTRPEMWSDYTHNKCNDFMCTHAVNYYVRDNRLHVVVQMRSNDAWAGYRNDYAWQRTVQQRLCADLGQHIIPGDITWQVGSLHLYEGQFYLLEKFIETGKTQ